ncbi:MAG TPA: DegV family protein [Acidimicrobiales bacterium]|nr:DegV family protein [Acidimicrobiales bacterium]
MAGVRIVTDSACDLSEELAGSNRIDVVPLTVRFGQEELLDRRDLTAPEFWARCRDAAELPETSAPPPGAFQAAYERAAADGATAILCVTISAALSATYQSARTAADATSAIEVAVLDTRSVTMGEGLLALTAAEAAASGASLAEVRAVTEEAMTRTRVFGALGTLEHLQRGGRIGKARALLGSMLSIKPVIEVRDGVVDEESKQRTRSRSLEYLAAKAKGDAPLERLAVASGEADDVGVLLGLLEGVEVARPIDVVELGPVVGTHAGPGTIGVCYLLGSGSGTLGR